MGIEVPLSDVIRVTGGAVSETYIRAKRKWMRDCGYLVEEESSMKGAALLGKKHLEETADTRFPSPL